MRYNQKQPTKKRLWLIIGLVVIASGAALAILELTNTTHLFHKKQRFAPTASSETKGELNHSSSTVQSRTGDDKKNTDKNTAAGTEPGDEKSSSGGQSSNAPLIDPTGNFVSNHHPNLGGSPAPNTMQSICNTTPGASCAISFSKDGVTKSLPTQVTDRGGATYWNWKLQDLSLTAGSWKIQAIATQNGQTKTAGDALNLEVGN